MEKSIYTPEYAFLCATLVKIRNEAGLTQRELALRLKVPHSWVAKVESGERRVDLVELIWVVIACGLDPSVTLADLATKMTALRKKRPRIGGRPQ
jgi:transcriptional regulator with XRE-family HTH domain